MDNQEEWTAHYSGHYRSLYESYRQRYKKLRKRRLWLFMVTALLSSSGTIAGSLTLNPFVMGTLTGTGLLIGTYIETSGINNEISHCKLAYSQIYSLLMEIESVQRGADFEKAVLLSRMTATENMIADFCPPLDNGRLTRRNTATKTLARIYGAIRGKTRTEDRTEDGTDSTPRDSVTRDSAEDNIGRSQGPCETGECQGSQQLPPHLCYKEGGREEEASYEGPCHGGASGEDLRGEGGSPRESGEEGRGFAEHISESPAHDRCRGTSYRRCGSLPNLDRRREGTPRCYVSTPRRFSTPHLSRTPITESSTELSPERDIPTR